MLQWRSRWVYEHIWIDASFPWSVLW
jgi:hypothetical protein